VRRFLQRVGRDRWNQVVALAHADRVARAEGTEDLTRLIDAVDRAIAAKVALTAGDLAITCEKPTAWRPASTRWLSSAVRTPSSTPGR